ncbi:MAG: lipase/acyltransferase domain-containing protein [Gammaproteobacteria bacterium]
MRQWRQPTAASKGAQPALRSTSRLPVRDPSARNPVIVIPGVLGSKLVAEADSRSVWGEWRTGFSDPASGEGAQLLGLPIEYGTPLDELRGQSRVDGALDTVRGYIAGMPVKITAYGDVMSAMGVESHADTVQHDRQKANTSEAAAFEFSYDWRRSLDECAMDFADFVARTSRFLQIQRRSSEPIRFDVVAHSMGGLVLRYFLQYGRQLLPYDDAMPRLTWAGAAHIEKAVIVGTPNAGSLTMIDRLVRGIPKNALHPTYGPVLLGTFPSGYQLLPRNRHQPGASTSLRREDDVLDPDFWLSRDWGITASWLKEERARQFPDIDNQADRIEAAEDHLRKCLFSARRFQSAMDQPAPGAPDHLEYHLFMGETQKTARCFTGARGDRTVSWTDYGPGDGTVLTSSARLTESDGRSPIPWRSVTALRSNHMGLLKDPALFSRVLRLLGDKAAPEPI